jgi:preprotein translocase subunit Sec63
MGILLKLLIGLVAAALLYAWLKRSFAAPAMRANEARTLLGVRDDANVEEIRAAHRRLIAKVHPDAGGSAGLASQLNAARDALLAEMRRRS